MPDREEAPDNHFDDASIGTRRTGLVERLLFRKIELWAVAAMVLVGAVITIAFGAAVRHHALGGASLGSWGPRIDAVAAFPSTAKRVLLGVRDPKLDLATPEQRFPGDAGFKFNHPPGTRSDLAYLLLNRYDGDHGRSVSELWDLRAQEKVHEWRFDGIDALWRRSTLSSAVDFRVDSRTVRFQSTHALLDDSGSVAVAAYSPLLRADVCSSLSLVQDSAIFHHSLERDADGNLWVPKRIEPKSVDLGDRNFWDDGITLVSPKGKVLFERSVIAILDANGLGHLVFGRGEAHPDPIHLNDIQPVSGDGPHWRKGDVFLSLRNQSMVLLYRPSTDRVLWHKLGPWFHQHDVNILDDHRISVFDNHAVASGIGSWVVRGSNRLLVVDLASGEVTSPWQRGFELLDVRTPTAGRGDVVGDDVVVEESAHGRLLQFDREGRVSWQFVNRAADGRVYYLNWSRLVPRTVGDRVRNTIARSQCK